MSTKDKFVKINIATIPGHRIRPSTHYDNLHPTRSRAECNAQITDADTLDKGARLGQKRAGTIICLKKMNL